MAKNETKNQVQVEEETIEATVETQGEPATTENEPKKESLAKRAKKKVDGVLDKDIGTPRQVLKKLGKIALIVGGVAGAFMLGKKVQETNDSNLFETGFGEEPVAELPDNVVEEVYEEPEEVTEEEYVEE